MKLSISNIAWSAEYDKEIYSFLQKNGYQGLEIAPTRIFPNAPYDHIPEASEWAKVLKAKYQLAISSMQSIWYGHSEKMFSSNKERKTLVGYTKKAILFAEAIGCKNLVFGNPRNRDTKDVQADLPIAINFFKEIGDYAHEHHTAIALEPNPIIYNTNFMNFTQQAAEIAYKVNSEGIKVNVDLGTIIYNNEDLEYLKQISGFINHIHISEPGLKLIKQRENMHLQLLNFAKEYVHDAFVSIEMGKQEIKKVKQILKYIKELITEPCNSPGPHISTLFRS